MVTRQYMTYVCVSVHCKIGTKKLNWRIALNLYNLMCWRASRKRTEGRHSYRALYVTLGESVGVRGARPVTRNVWRKWCEEEVEEEEEERTTGVGRKDIQMERNSERERRLVNQAARWPARARHTMQK